jgi:hypothetical protein
VLDADTSTPIAGANMIVRMSQGDVLVSGSGEAVRSEDDGRFTAPFTASVIDPDCTLVRARAAAPVPDQIEVFVTLGDNTATVTVPVARDQTIRAGAVRTIELGDVRVSLGPP